MSKNIVILNGSPRKKGNTSMLANAFAEGARCAGNMVTEFFLDSMEIHGCKGCFGGHSSQACPCVQKDDMAQILHGRASVLLMAAEGHGFEDVLVYYDHLMEHLRWKNLGHVLAGGNMNVGDIQDKPELRQAYELGKSIR